MSTIVPEGTDRQAVAPSESMASAWSEGYSTALRDFGIQVTDDDIENRISPNPYGSRIARRNLSEHEKTEIRHALGFHFEDCITAEFEDQATILELVVERILSRRPERSA
jgi:hypothetical protein